jgi:hypothetical protein
MKAAVLGWLALSASWTSSVQAAPSSPSPNEASSRVQQDGVPFLREPAAPESQVFPSQQASRDLRRARALEGRLVSLPGVTAAEVTLQRVHPALVPLDQPLPPARARVTLRLDASAARPRELETIVSELRSEGCEVTVEIADAPASTLGPSTAPAAIGAFRAPSPDDRGASEGTLRHVLAVSLLGNVLLATLLLLRSRRHAFLSAFHPTDGSELP